MSATSTVHAPPHNEAHAASAAVTDAAAAESMGAVGHDADLGHGHADRVIAAVEADDDPDKHAVDEVIPFVLVDQDYAHGSTSPRSSDRMSPIRRRAPLMRSR